MAMTESAVIVLMFPVFVLMVGIHRQTCHA